VYSISQSLALEVILIPLSVITVLQEETMDPNTGPDSAQYPVIESAAASVRHKHHRHVTNCLPRVEHQAVHGLHAYLLVVDNVGLVSWRPPAFSPVCEEYLRKKFASIIIIIW
jgi:hypothetical protein